MRAHSKRRFVRIARAAQVPVMIVATAGTTNAGMIDPLSALRRDRPRTTRFGTTSMRPGEERCWRVSACAARFDGNRTLADSITIDAHKWFATTMGCGMFMTRHATLPSSVFHVATSFMPSNLTHVDPYVTTAQWSRRFLGLRLFLSLAAAGWQGYAAHVERAIKLMAMLKEELEQRGWSIANDSPLALLCVDARPEYGEIRPAREPHRCLRSRLGRGGEI
jgi:glutamate/tyrosine decarboxylase-like PLP-dependent enzyme